MRSKPRSAALAILLWTAGCSGARNPGPDAGHPPDAAVLPDANRDASELPDAPATCGTLPASVIELRETGRTAHGVAYRVRYTVAGREQLGQICVPTAPGRHPVLTYMHGGFDGMPDQWGIGDATVCAGFTRLGYAVVAAQYRGQSDTEGSSEGQIELCLGEADDALGLLEVARARCDVDPERLVLFGGSHGGCLALQMARRGMPAFRAVAIMGPPTDLALLYRYHEANLGTGDAHERAVHRMLYDRIRALVGTPDAQPEAFEARSPLRGAEALARADTPLMVVHGTADYFVPHEHACQLRDAMVRAGGAFVDLHLGPDGEPTTRAVPGCAGLAPVVGPWPDAFAQRRYLVALEGSGHAFAGAQLDRALEAMVRFLVHHTR